MVGGLFAGEFSSGGREKERVREEMTLVDFIYA